MVTIYAMTHKKSDFPKDKMYVPMQVGHACREDLGYLGDDTGEHISQWNCYYAELTGLYWLWKNEHKSDILGICHYRRYLLNQNHKLFQQEEIEDLLYHKGYEIITTKKVILDCSYYEGFAGKHNIEDLQQTEQVIREIYPQYLSTFQRLVHENKTYFGNMMIAKKELFCGYAEWLFRIFFTLQKRIDPSQYDEYRKRVYGFISEFLLYVYATYHELKTLECDVAVIGEKKETSETKQKLETYFETGDLDGAKGFFLEIYQKRPDILMEASDFDGSLKLAMQAIVTAEKERETGIPSLFEQKLKFSDTISFYRSLNQIIIHIKTEEESEEDRNKLRQLKPSVIAEKIAVSILCKKEQKEYILEKLEKIKA